MGVAGDIEVASQAHIRSMFAKLLKCKCFCILVYLYGVLVISFCEVIDKALFS